MFFRHGLSRKDAILILLGASSMHLYTLLFASPVPAERPIVIRNQMPHAVDRIATFTKELVLTREVTKTVHHLDPNVVTSTVPSKPTPIIQSIPPSDALPQTNLLAHSPGWTLFRNLYMSNGTLFIIADAKTRGRFPEIRLMTSTGLAAENTPENIAMREPTAENMAFVTPEEAQRRWGASAGGMNRVWTVEGNTVSESYSILLLASCDDQRLTRALASLQRSPAILEALLPPRRRALLWRPSILAWCIFTTNRAAITSGALFSSPSSTATHTQSYLCSFQCRRLAR